MFVPFLVVALMWEYYVFCSCSTLFPLGILFCLTRESSAKGATTIIDNENEELDVSILQTCQAQHISYNVIAQSRNRQPNNVLELNKCSQELDHSKESVTLLTPTLLSPIYHILFAVFCLIVLLTYSNTLYSGGWGGPSMVRRIRFSAIAKKTFA